MKKPKSVDEYIENQSQWEHLLIPIREILLGTGMEEHVKWVMPCYTDRGKNIASFYATKTFVGIWFFQGAMLNDEYGVLHNAQEGKTKAMRQWQFKKLEDIDKDKIEAYLYEAIENQRAGRIIKVDRSKKIEIVIPVELKTAFSNNSELRTMFEAFSSSKQRDYCEHIGGAKREETRKNRLQKSIPMILAGEGLNDKYIKK